MSLASIRERLLAQPVGGRFNAVLWIGIVLSVVGVPLTVIELLGPNADRAWQLFHVNWIYFTGLALGSVAVVAVHKVANAKWSGFVLRFAAPPVYFLPLSFIGLLLIFGPGYHHIYPVMHDLFPGKAIWLTRWVMFVRLAVTLLVLFVLAFLLIRTDLVPDLHAIRSRVDEARRRRWDKLIGKYDGSEAAERENFRRVRRFAPIFLMFYAFVMTLVAFDGTMALQPHWFSNLLGGFYFMGAFLGANMMLAIMLNYGRYQLGIPDLVSPKQRHDQGKLCFGFTVFWAYLMWSQFIVIWYGNLPEETGFLFARLWGPWMPVARAVFAGIFVLPFFGLLGVAPKKFPPTMMFFASISLIALWLERYLLIMPSVTHESGPILGLAEAAPTLAFAGLFLLCYALFARSYPMVSPRLAEITVRQEMGHHLEAFEHTEGPQDYIPEAR